MSAQGLLGELDEEIAAGEFLEAGCGFGDQGDVGVEVAQVLADHDVADVQGRVETAGDTGEDDGVGAVRADEVLRRGRGVDGAHTGRGGNDLEAVVFAAHDVQAGLVGDGALLDGGVDLAHFLLERSDDGDDRCHGSPIFKFNRDLFYQHRVSWISIGDRYKLRPFSIAGGVFDR